MFHNSDFESALWFPLTPEATYLLVEYYEFIIYVADKKNGIMVSGILGVRGCLNK